MAHGDDGVVGEPLEGMLHRPLTDDVCRRGLQSTGCVAAVLDVLACGLGDHPPGDVQRAVPGHPPWRRDLDRPMDRQVILDAAGLGVGGPHRNQAAGLAAVDQQQLVAEPLNRREQLRCR